jgi:hypothetical protein
MTIVKINRTKVELRNQFGILQRVICEGAQNAQINNEENLIVVTKLNGKVELRNTSGILQRVISEGAQDAKFVGNDIFIQKSRGKSELRDQFGRLIRYI